MPNASEILEQQFFEMRWRVLSLAADFDRIQRAGDGAMPGDPRLTKLREAIEVLKSAESDRAARVQMIFSGKSEPPMRHR
jgi:hypothetical protein